jgi:uncharacterized membrane protein
MEARTARLSARQERLVIAVDRMVYHVARRWLWLLNGVGLLFVLAAFLPPMLLESGHSGSARWVYRGFHLICHQRDDRSFHVFGHKMAYCERDFAIYAGFLVVGLGYGVLRRLVRPASVGSAIALSLPMAIDGLTQATGLRESTWQLRVVTGALFAVGVAWLVYPRLEEGFAEICATLERRFECLVREGRAAPL